MVGSHVLAECLKREDVKKVTCITRRTSGIKNPRLIEVLHDDFLDYTKAFGEALRKFNDIMTFCFLSGQGADSSGKSKIQFARDKGIAENILLNLKFGKTYIFRPGYIYPVKPRKEPNLIYKISCLSSPKADANLHVLWGVCTKTSCPKPHQPF